MSDFYHEFLKVRKLVAEAIREYLKEDCGHKSYEGTWELRVSYPNYFEDDTAAAPPDSYCITLHCYIIGPGRHYDWVGKSWDEALKKCKNDVAQWVSECGFSNPTIDTYLQKGDTV